MDPKRLAPNRRNRMWVLGCALPVAAMLLLATAAACGVFRVRLFTLPIL